MSPSHRPILPPFSASKKAELTNLLAELRRLVIDLQHAASSGLPVQPELDQAQAGITRLQRLHDAYFQR